MLFHTMLCYLPSETQCSMTHHANVYRFIEVDKAIRSMCKKLVLQRFDFAFNDNGSVRDNPLLQQVSHLPDTNPYLRRELERERNNSLQADVVRKLGQPMYSKTGVV